MGASAPPVQIAEFRRRAVHWFRDSASGLELREYAPDQPIYLDQQAADQLFLIESGQVKLVVSGRDGHSSGVLALRLPGELLGELSICGQARRSEGAIALAPVTLRAARTSAFMDFVQSEKLESHLLEYLVWSLIEQRRTLAMLLVDSSEQRLAHALLGFAQSHDDLALPLTLSWQHLGELIGTPPARVGELLERLRSLGLIVGDAQSGLRVDPERLERYCR